MTIHMNNTDAETQAKNTQKSECDIEIRNLIMMWKTGLIGLILISMVQSITIILLLLNRN